MTDELRFDGQVAIVTGAGNGLGKSHALLLASRGAKVVVNDLGGDIHGDGNRSSAAADAVVEEIKAAGGEAVANYDSVEDGEAIVKTAVDAFGTVDIVINNAGILRDVSFAKMTDKDWDLINTVHLRGSYKVSHAAWPIMKEKGYGRIIMTTSAAGIYGNFGQANYSSAKLGLVGLSNTLAVEGRKSNIHVNTIAPIAGSRLTETILPPDLLEKLKPEYVSPLVAWLCNEKCEETGGLFEVGAGFIGKLRWERNSKGVFNTARGLSPENVASNWARVTDFEDADHPADVNSAMGQMLQAMNNPPKGGNEFIDLDKAAKEEIVLESSYDERDLAIYALGIGAARDPNDEQERNYVYELAGGFQAFPTYGVMPQMGAMLSEAKKGTLSLPGMNFGFDRLLHGEQFTELKRPLPAAAKMKHSFKVKEAFDKDPHAVVTFAITSTDVDTGEELIYNEMTAFVKGAGGWGGERGESVEENVAPDREPDAVIEEKTDANQTLLYRLSGDWNPLHADPAFAKAFGFDKPILHGLCTFGYCGRHVIKAFADNDGRYFKNIKVRFAKSVYPGDTLVTKMWKDSSTSGDTKIIFETSVKERDEVVIKNAAIELYEEIPEAKVVETNSEDNSVAAAEPTAEAGAEQVVALLSEYVAQHPELVGQIGKVYQWNIKNPDLDFVLDLKNAEGSVTKGTADNDCSLEIEESDLMALMRGEADAQKLYFGGKLTVGGDIMASQKLQFLADMDPAEVQAALSASAAPAPAEEESTTEAGAQQVIGMLKAYVTAHPELVDQVGKVYQWQVKNPDCDFVLDLKNGAGDVIAGTADHDTTIELDESDLMGMMRGEADAQKLYFAGKLKIAGDIMASQKLQFLADMDPAEVQAALKASAPPPKAEASAQPKVAKAIESPKVFAALGEKLAADKSAANGASGVLQFHITDADQYWTVDLTGDTPVVEEGATNQPHAIFGMADADLLALVKGEGDVRDLYQRGKLRVDGDVRQAKELTFLNGLV